MPLSIDTNEGRQTKILMGIALVFVFCQCFTIIPDIDELICTISGSKCQDIIYTYNIIEFGHLMLAVNSSVNFVFYIIHIPLLKEEIKKVPKHINKNKLLIRYKKILDHS